MATQNTASLSEDPTIDWTYRDDSPDWTVKTPDEDTYELVMFDGGGGSSQQVCMTRTEFLVLKAHLAAMRGHVEIDVKTKIKLASGMPLAPGLNLSSYPESIAADLRTARALYRMMPDLVLAENTDIDTHLQEFAAPKTPAPRVKAKAEIH